MDSSRQSPLFRLCSKTPNEELPRSDCLSASRSQRDVIPTSSWAESKDRSTKSRFGHHLVLSYSEPAVYRSRVRWQSNPLQAALQAVAVPSGSSVTNHQCPRQELNLALDLRRVACDPPHSEDVQSNQRTSPRNRTSSCSFEGGRAHPAHPQGIFVAISRPGLEPGPGPSEGPMQSATPSGFKTAKSRRPDSRRHQPVYKTGAFLYRATSAASLFQHEREESNPVRQLWRLTALPGTLVCW